MEYQPNFETNANIEQLRSSYLKQRISQKAVSKIREISPQVCAVIVTNILSVELGLCIGFIRIIIPVLHEENSDICVTVDELTWMSSIMFLMTPVGCALSGVVTQYFGRRQTLLLSAIPFSMEWLLLYRAMDPTIVMIGLGLIGMNAGLVHSPIMIYVAEISKPHLRGIFLIVCPLAISLGIFIETLISRYVDWRTVTLINLGCPLIGFVALLFIPESPHWLASTGRLIETERSLCWLRGWVSPDYIKSEHRNLCKTFAKSGYPAGIDPTQVESNEIPKEPISKKLQPYLKRTFWAPFSLLLFIFFIKTFGGTMIIQTFTTVIFDWLKSPIDNNLATTISGSVELLACGISLLIIHFIGKRKLTLISLCTLCIFHSLLAFYCYFSSQYEIDENAAYMAVILVISIAFFSHLGIKIIPHILMGEIFPMVTRSIGIGLVNTIGYCLISVGNKIFYYMVDDITMAGTFFFFAIVNLVGCIVLYFVLPETEGKTLQEIEKCFATGQSNQTQMKKKICRN